MSKRSNRIPPALRHGIYSAIGLLPTEDPAEFEKFKQEIFDEYVPGGRSERNIVENMACKMWRRQNLFTLRLGERARDRRNSIDAELNPPGPSPSWLRLEPDFPEPETPSPEELAARRKAADDQARTELGGTMELVKVGPVATFEYMEKELAMMARLDAEIVRDLKSLLYVRGIKSMSSSGAVAPSQPRLSKAA